MLLVGAVSALWLGVLTSISPCPLATNIAAISFISREVRSGRRALLAGLAYAAGRTIVYIAIGVIVTWGVLAAWRVGPFLERYMNRALGPILILVGMVLLNLLKLRFSTSVGVEKAQRLAQGGGILSAGLIGVLFALSFCPSSAGLFFGGLITLAVKHDSSFLLPALFGIGTAAPVVAVSILLTISVKYATAAFQRVQQAEKWVRAATGCVFILIGIYYSLRYIFEVF